MDSINVFSVFLDSMVGGVVSVVYGRWAMKLCLCSDLKFHKGLLDTRNLGLTLSQIYPAWNFHLVTSLPAKTFGDRFCFSRKGGIGEVGGCTKGCRQHGHLWALLWKCLGWLWVGHCSPPMHEQVEKTVLSPCTVPISGGEAFIPVWASGCQLIAVTIASTLMSECGLSHKHVEDGCKSTCVEFGG